MARFRSLRWRLTAFYLGLLAVLLLVGGFAQYFAAREVLFRTNAKVLTSEYAAVLTAFRKQNVNRPAAALRALILSNQFSSQLASRHTSAAIFDLNGGRVAEAPAALSSTEDFPTLTTQQYLDAISGEPRSYYIAGSGDGSTHLVLLNVIRNGTKALGLAQLSIPTDEIDQTLRAHRQLAIIGSLLVLLLALLLSPLIIGRALRPLEQVSATAGGLAAGDYKQRVTVPNTNDEIGKLAVAFNQMAAGIDQAFEVRRQSEAEMRHFVADASHELRTPLTSIAGYIDVLSRRQNVDSETLHESLRAMQQETSRMTRLVNDLLTLTRFESGTAPHRQRLRLDAFLNQALDDRRDFNRDAERQLAGSQRLTGMPPALAKHLVDQVGGAVEHLRLLLEARG